MPPAGILGWSARTASSGANRTSRTMPLKRSRAWRAPSRKRTCLLARIPLVEDNGVPVLARKANGLRAQRLRGDTKDNELTRLLAKDELLGRFVRPASQGERLRHRGPRRRGRALFLGLRGPVLRGWAIVLEVRVTGAGKSLALAPLEGHKRKRLRKHFLQLRGLGVRDLCLDGHCALVKFRKGNAWLTCTSKRTPAVGVMSPAFNNMYPDVHLVRPRANVLPSEQERSAPKRSRRGCVRLCASPMAPRQPA